MLETAQGTHAEILTPAVRDEKNEPQPYKSNFTCSVTINRPAEELYAFWRDFTNLPRFMENIESITCNDAGQSHWVVKGPTDTVEWDSRLIEDVPGRRLVWKSEEGADVDNAGFVEFKQAPGERGTEVRVQISFKAPMGGLGRMIAGWMQKDPHIQAKRDLRRFKQLMETGEIAVSPANQDPPAS
jgi:uncharacterized membrane protein